MGKNKDTEELKEIKNQLENTLEIMKVKMALLEALDKLDADLKKDNKILTDYAVLNGLSTMIKEIGDLRGYDIRISFGKGKVSDSYIG